MTRKITALLLVNVFSMPTWAANDVLYYTIGGGPVISAPARADHISRKTLGVNWNLDLQCGQLDPQLTVKNQLNGVTEGFQDMMGNILTNATSAVMSLPGYYLQKEDPGLYDLMTNGVLQGKFDFDDAKTSCEAITKNLGEMSPSNAWTQLSQGQAWTQAVKSGDAVQAQITVEKSVGNKGVIWKGGHYAGGKNQPPIRVNSDTAKAGFDMLTDGVSQTNKEGLYRYWDSSDAMADWLTGVIGDKVNQTGTDKTQLGAQPGIGLNAEVAKTASQLQVDVNNAVSGGNISSTFPPSLINALRNDPLRRGLSKRLVSEVALTQTIDKALQARRVLLTGKNEAYISQNSLAQEDINRSVKELENEISLLRFEAETRQSIAGNTAEEILIRQQYRDAQPKPDTQSLPSSYEGGKFN